jgi:hypothetical protein
MASMAGYGSGLRTGLLAMPAVVLALAAAPEAALAEPDPEPNVRVFVKYSYFSETIQPGQTGEVRAPCPKKQSLLSSSIAPASTGPGPDGAEAPLFVYGIVPSADEVRVTFQNRGTIAAAGQVAVACLKAKGTKIEADVVKDQVTFTEAGSATATRTCTKKGTIPGEVGFSGSATFAGAEYFKSKGDIGARLGFAGFAGSQAEMRMVCLRASGVRMTGALVGDLSQTGPAEAKKGKRPKLVVDYGSESISPRPDLSNAGGSVFVGQGGGTPWTSPYPGPPGTQALGLAGRGYADLGAARGSLEGIATAFVLIEILGPTEEEESAARLREYYDMAVRASKTAAFNAVDFANDPATDPGGGTGEGSKTVRPFQGVMSVPNCSPGFSVDIYIDADAQQPAHSFLENGGEPPCPNATVEVTRFPAGEQPPGNTDPEEDWRTHQTYRIQITSPTSATPSPQNFAIHVFWTDPSP